MTMEKMVSLEGLEGEAVLLAKTVRPKTRGAFLVTLSGELGAGKTAFAQALARGFGIKDAVTSPTFTLLKAYDLPAGSPFARLIHLDAYRLTSADELLALGVAELLQDPRNLIVCEWPENVRGALPVPDVSITMTPQPDGVRKLTYEIGRASCRERV